MYLSIDFDVHENISSELNLANNALCDISMIYFKLFFFFFSKLHAVFFSSDLVGEDTNVATIAKDVISFRFSFFLTSIKTNFFLGLCVARLRHVVLSAVCLFVFFLRCCVIFGLFVAYIFQKKKIGEFARVSVASAERAYELLVQRLLLLLFFLHTL